MKFVRECLNQWLLGVGLHFILLLIAGKLKEKSPLLPKSYLLKQDEVPKQGPCDRLVLIIVEGLRWDVYHAMRNLSHFPYFVLYSGTSGPVVIEYPSSSYSGLLTIATGIPERVSHRIPNIFQQTKTLYIGPPSVRRAFPDLKESRCYPELWENITASPNENRPDEWVFKQWEHLLSDPTPVIFRSKLFFLYFSGLNMASRLDGPMSPRASEEMKYIFDGLYSLYEKTEEFFKDKKTSYIVTSDCGQAEGVKEVLNPTNESLVPLLTWGAGLAAGNQITTQDITRLDFRFHSRMHAKQQDLTPFISYLMSTRIPANNLGNASVERLSTNEDRAKLSLLNSKQLTNLYLGFEKAFGFGLSALTAPVDKTYISMSLKQVELLLDNKYYDMVIAKCQELIDSALDGITYYRCYELNTLWVCAVVGLIAWTATTFGWVVDKIKMTPIIQRELVAERSQEDNEDTCTEATIVKRFLTPPCLVNVFMFLSLVSLVVALMFVSAPLVVTLAAAMAVTAWWLVARNVHRWRQQYRSVTSNELRVDTGKPITHLAYFLILASSLSIPILVHLMFSLAIMFSSLTDLRKSFSPHLSYWLLSSMSYFILLHYEFNTPSFPVLVLAAVFWIVSGGIFLNLHKSSYLDLPIFLVAFLSMAVIVVLSHYGPFLLKESLILRWAPATLIFFVPVVGSSSLPVRLFQLFLCLSLPIFLLSLSFEPISFLVILNHLFSWMILEGFPDVFEFFTSSLQIPAQYTSISWADARRCHYFLAYILTSFLVIGNSCELDKWPKGWPSYFRPASDFNAYFLVCLKSLPVILAVSVFLATLEKKNSAGFLTLILHLSAQVSLFNFMLFWDSSITTYNQLMFLLTLAMRPIAYLFLSPSVFSLMARPAESISSRRNAETKETSL